MAKHAAIYVRISKDAEGSSLGVERQRADCIAFCDERGWTYTAYDDNDVSAFGRKPRPQWAEACRSLKEGAADVLLGWHPDRFYRNHRDLEDLIELIEATGATVKTVTAGEFDLATPEGRLQARIVCSVARKESEDKSRRLRRKHLELAERGMPTGGKRWYGYTYPTHDTCRRAKVPAPNHPDHDGMAVIEHEAEIVREMASRVLAGESLVGIAKTLNERGEPTVTGKPWASTTVRGILLRPSIAGQRTHRGDPMPGEATWPPILTRETYETVRALLTNPARKPKSTNARVHALAGFAVCGADGCGAKLVSGKHPDGSSELRCKACFRIRVRMRYVERAALAAVVTAMELPSFGEAFGDTSEEGDDASHLLHALDERRARVLDLAEDGIINKGEAKARLASIEDERAVVIKRLTSKARRVTLADAPTKPADVQAWWEANTVEAQRALLDAFVDRIVIRPAKVRGGPFDPERVEVVPHGR